MTNKKGLSATAYVPPADGETYQPYVPASTSPAEFSIKAILMGIFFGVVFGAANAYLGLRTGLTISTSIPVAVMTVAVFSLLTKAGVRNSILETNISQTTGSASSSLASGIIFTLPALWLWQVAPSLLQMTVLALSGGLLGILFMIPLRRYLIDKEHGKLPYPEGTACAQVLVANEAGGSSARNIFIGLGVGALFKALTSWLHVIPGSVSAKIPFLKKGELGMDLSPALLGVGYILGPRIAAIMVGGGLLSWLVIIPAIAYWGEARNLPLYPEAFDLIKDMSPSKIWTRYVRYIGAGAVATAGIITLIRSIPVMINSFKMGTHQIEERLKSDSSQSVLRTMQDLPMKFVLGGALFVFAILAFSPFAFDILGSVGNKMVAALCVILFAFVFVTVSSRIVGLVGVTSNPTSGMTIATLLATSGVFLVFGWTDITGKVAAITVGCVVAIAASIAGDTSQDLKTGYLLGATPRKQQTAELIGVITSAVFVCLSVMLLAETFGFGTAELPAPQATLMKLVIDGVLDQNLPWGLVAMGVGIAIVCELVRIPSLPFAVGVYLPVSTMTPLFLGGLIRWWMERKASNEAEKNERREKGILLGSGFVGGEGLLGVAIAGVAFIYSAKPKGIGVNWLGELTGIGWLGEEWVAMLIGLLCFCSLAAWFFHRIKK